MAKRTKQPAQAGQDWSAPAAELLAELPADRDGLLAAAVAAVVEIDAAVMRGDGAAAELAGDRYEAIIWKLNGGTNFGCMADDEAAGRVIERHCAAVPGDVPLWGQRGQFLQVVHGQRRRGDHHMGHFSQYGDHLQVLAGAVRQGLVHTVGGVQANRAQQDVVAIRRGVGDRLAAEGILVNEVRPGVIATDMTSKVQGKYDALIEKGTFPIARWGTPDFFTLSYPISGGG